MPIPSPRAARQPDPPQTPILVLGGAAETIALLRLATIASDRVMLVSLDADAATRRVANCFSVDLHTRDWQGRDLDGAAAVLVSMPDRERENQAVGAARRRGIPVHVARRPAVSDFALLDLLEGRVLDRLAA